MIVLANLLNILLLCLKQYEILLLKILERRKIMMKGEKLRIRVISDDLAAILNGDGLVIKRHLRVSVDSFRLIVEYLPEKRHGWCLEYELTCFLYWMACGCSCRVAGGFIGMNRYTVRNIVHKYLNLFSEMGHLINLGSIEDYEENQKLFCKKARSNAFRNCIGAIDGTHVRINCHRNQQDAYINHKGFYSYTVQATVDNKGKLTDVFIGFPGSVHDTRVLKNSDLFKNGNYPLPGYFLLGDKGYPCRTSPIGILTPFKNPRTVGEKQFNAAHSRARIVIECGFGILKNRWSNIFNRDLELSEEKCMKTIFSAFILHNICLSKEDFNPYPIEALEEEVYNNEPRVLSDTQDGIRAINAIFQEFVEEQQIAE